MDMVKFAARLTALREQKKVSAREMSLALGQNVNYINAIENNKSLPSMEVFFYICDYLGVTPSEFFNTEIVAPTKLRDLSVAAQRLPAGDIDLLITIAQKLK